MPITMREVFRLRPEDGAMTSLSSWPDAAGNKFVAYRIMPPTSPQGYIKVVKYVNGVAAQQETFTLPYPFKADDVCIYQTGPHIDVEVVDHHPVQGNYFYASHIARWENVAVPYQQGDMPRSADGVALPDENPPQPGVDINYDTVEARDRKALGIGQGMDDPPFSQLFGGHRSPRQMIMDKVPDALLWMLDPNTTDPRALAFRFLLRYRTVEDGAYSACMNAIRDSGIMGKVMGPKLASANAEDAANDYQRAIEEGQETNDFLDKWRVELEAEE